MANSDDFVQKLEQFEHNGGQLDVSESAWYKDFLTGLSAKGELSLKSDLEAYYDAHSKAKQSKVVRLWTTVGIAAMLAVGGFYMTTVSSSSGPTPLQVNEAPIYSDSASYDSTQNVIEKKIEEDVDK